MEIITIIIITIRTTTATTTNVTCTSQSNLSLQWPTTQRGSKTASDSCPFKQSVL